MINLSKIISIIVYSFIFTVCVCFHSSLLHATVDERHVAEIMKEFMEKIEAEYSYKKEIDIFQNYSGSFDLNFDDRYSSSSIEDFFNYSKYFYQQPEDLLLEKGKYDEFELIRHLLHISKKSRWNGFNDKKVALYYREIRSFLNDLLVRHYNDLGINENSDKHPKNVYIFIGNSPLSLVLSLVEALKLKSDIINNKIIKKSLDRSIFIDIPYDISAFNKLSNIKDVDVYEYFARHIDPGILEGNNVIVVDLVRSGMNAGSFIRNLKKYILYSGIKESSFSADLFTFYPPSLYNSFLKNLSKYSFINVMYKDSYWNFLMRNLYLSRYDDAHRYYDNLLDKYYYLESEEFNKAYENINFTPIYFKQKITGINDDKIKFLNIYTTLKYKGRKLDLNFLDGSRVYNSNDIYDELWEKDFWYRYFRTDQRSSTRIFSYNDYLRGIEYPLIQRALLSTVSPSGRAPWRAGNLPAKEGYMIPYNMDAHILEDNEPSIYSKYESDWVSFFQSEAIASVKKEFQKLISMNEQMIENDKFFTQLGPFCVSLFSR